MAEQLLTGIHHVTAIAGDPQKNVDFYTNILSLRLVKKTVNFDDPFTYHLYFGDDVGHPGTLLTFFPWSGQAHRGRKGSGQLTVYSFAVPPDSLGYWKDRLKQFNVKFSGPISRFGEEVLTGIDHDGFQFELVATADNKREGWENGITPAQHAIRGFHSVTLSELSQDPTAHFLKDALGFPLVGEAENRYRFRAGDNSFVDILHQPNLAHGYMGVGVVHHVAWRTPTDESQVKMRTSLERNGVGVTPVIDRNYFHSIYFNEPGGVIFEVATDPPGFLIDESKDQLGTNLKLPPQYESRRKDIEAALMPITLPTYHEVR